MNQQPMNQPIEQPQNPTVSRTRVRAALATINIALVGVVALTLWPTTVGAQAPVGASRARGDYTMIAGEIAAGSNAVTYVIDSANQEVLVLRWDRSRSQFQTIGYRDLAADAVAAPVR